MATLVVVDGPLEGRRFEFGDELTIGRAEGDVLLDDLQVSRRHAILRRLDAGYEIEDLSSANGTYVDGVRISEPTPLAADAVISVGGSRARLEVESSEPVTQAPPRVPDSAPLVHFDADGAHASPSRPGSRFSRAITSRRGKWLTALAWLVVAVAIGGGFGGKVANVSSALSGSVDALGGHSASTQIAALERRYFAAGETYTATLVYRRAAGLTAADHERVQGDAAAVARLGGVGRPLPGFTPNAPVPTVSTNGQVAITIIPLSSGNSKDRDATIAAIRRTVGNGGGALRVELTGPAVYLSDINGAIGKADASLLLATGLLVILLLLAIYRSPLLALIPLIVVGISYLIATGLIYLYAKATGQIIDKTVLTLLAVLMFGVGTDYCLLLVSRYTADLRKIEDRHDAMSTALSKTSEAILASGGTVIGAMLCFWLADLKTDRQIAAVNAIGIAVVMLAGVTLLPALLTMFGRGAFWPNRKSVVVQPGRSLTAVIETSSLLGGKPNFWFRVATRVASRPKLALVVIAGTLAFGAGGLALLHESTDETKQFRLQNGSTRGLDLLLKGFPPGASYPETVMLHSANGPVTPGQVQAARSKLAAFPGVVEVSDVVDRSRDGSRANLVLAYGGNPFAGRTLDLSGRLQRYAANLGPGVSGLVGGGSSARKDYRDAVNRDSFVIVPAVLLVILGMLALLLRALVAPLYLLATVLLSYFGTLGLSVAIFHYVLGQTTVDPFLPLITFVFLGALGVDYNIFLMSRVREEARTHGTQEGLVRALVATGPVVTSAGVILAGTFALLTILPLWILLEIGFTVSLGVLIDTFIVRTLAVPALVQVFGDRSWWPSRASAG